MMPRLSTAGVVLLTLLPCSVTLQMASADQPDSARVLESQGEFELALKHLQARASSSAKLPASPGRSDVEALRSQLRLLIRRRDNVAAQTLLERQGHRLETQTRQLLGAILALRLEDPEGALQQLSGASFPGALQAFAHKLRAEAYFELERWAQARDAVSAAGVATLPLEMRRRLRVIESYAAFELGDYARLRRLAPQLGRDARSNDRTGLILLELAEVVLAQGDAAQAREWLFELLDARRTPADSASTVLQRQLDAGTWVATPEELLRLARHEMERGRSAGARMRLRTLLGKERELQRKDAAAAWVGVAETYQRQGSHSSCLETLAAHSRQIVGTPSEPEMLRLRARSLRSLGNEDGAIAVYRDLAQRFPNHPRADDALYEAGWRYEIRDDFRAAEAVYASLQRHFPRSKLRDDAALREGLCAFRDARWDAALAHFRTFTVRYPNSTLVPRAVYWRLWIQEARGDTTRANALRARLQRDFPVSYFTILASRTDLRTPVPRLDAGAPVHQEANALELAYRSYSKYHAAIDRLRRAGSLVLPASFEESARLWRFCLDHGLAAEAQWETRRLEHRFKRRAGALMQLLESNYERGAHERLVSLSYLISLRLSRPSHAEALEILRHPAPFSVTLAEAARRNGVSHAVVLAVMRHESAFDPRIDSPAGARGLMQLMPEVGLRLARQTGQRQTHVDDLYDPVLNMTLGCRLFSQELRRAQGRVEQALAAYNAGSGPAAKWIQRLQPQEPRELYLDVAEYVETRSYLERVLGSGEVYRRLYDLP
jgi:soluble lytic murein transglycosylase